VAYATVLTAGRFFYGRAAPTQREEAMAKKAETTVQIEPIRRGRAVLVLEGDSIIITHNFSERSKQAIRGKQQGTKVRQGKKELVNPELLFKEALYVFGNNTIGFPATWIKQSTVKGCRMCDIPMTRARQALFFKGTEDPEHIEILKSAPQMREDPVPTGGMGSGWTLAYRAEFPLPWEAEVEVEWLENVMTLEQVITLVNYGGFSAGIGAWRPERGGNKGRYHVKSAAA